MRLYETASEFYNSTEWRNLRASLIQTRLNEYGEITCAECGKPIIRDFECIGHHIEEITPHNLNDHRITLNPDNIALLHIRCHNNIHNRFSGQRAAWQRKVYYVYGAPCAGKSSFVAQAKGANDLVVDIDNIWEALTGERYLKPNALKTNAFTLRDCLLDMVRTRSGRWDNAWIIEGGALGSERRRKIALYGAEPIFIDTDKGECMKRLHSDLKRGREHCAEWEGYIERWFNDFTE